MTMRELVRFFRVVPPVPPLMVTTFIVVAAVSVAAIAVDARYASGTVDAVIVLQLFAVSSGFAGNARRGYYDLLLTRGEHRVVVAMVHWALSAAPGVTTWAVVAMAEATLTAGASTIGFAAGTILALAATSTIGWAVTVPLPRFAGAIGWVVTVAMAAALRPAAGAPEAVTNVIFPLTMVGRPVVSLAGTLPVAIVSAATMAGALVWVERVDVRLEAAQ
jgi:hypothetical protein